MFIQIELISVSSGSTVTFAVFLWNFVSVCTVIAELEHLTINLQPSFTQ